MQAKKCGLCDVDGRDTELFAGFGEDGKNAKIEGIGIEQEREGHGENA